MKALLANPLARLYLFIVIALPLFHWAHRFRFTLVDLGLKSIRGLVTVLCYGAAIVGMVLAAFLLISL
jgi:fumarate reductase subunit D